MKSTKTVKKLSRKYNKKRTQKAGGLFKSNAERIIEELTKQKTLTKEQGKEILNASKTGNNKENKINLFVDNTIHILLLNLFDVWKQRKATVNITDKTYSELINELNSQPEMNKQNEYKKLHNLYLILHKLGKQSRDDFAIKLDGDNANKQKQTILGGNILVALYQLNDNWVNEEVMKTINDPKFADLYRLWFNKPYRDWLERNMWWLWWVST